MCLQPANLSLASIPSLEKAVVLQENGLSTLLGRNPGPIARGKTIDQLVAPAIVAGMPSTLLERRPDIRQAEQNLIAANAQIGVARAAYFPSISLTGALGSASGDLGDLFAGPAKTWQFSAPLTVPIFTAGKIAGNVEAAEALRQQALLSYRKAIENGFREVDDALAGHLFTQKQLAAQKRQVDSLRQYAEIARLRYENGYADYLSVLDAERSLFNARLASTQTQAALHQSLIDLYKAMGGGWATRPAPIRRERGEQTPTDPSVVPKPQGS
nr:TolC family protein [uncultured Desulfobulbus sp.]